MSFGLHRAVEGRAGRPRSTRRKRRPFALLDFAGGTGDIAFRVLAAGGEGTARDGLRHQCRHAGGRARPRRGARSARRVDLRRRQCRGPAVRRRSFDASTIAFGIRNVPRIEVALAEAFRVLKIGGRFLCLEFSPDVPGLDKLYDALFVQRYSGARPRGRRRRRILSLSGGIDPPFPKPQPFADMLRTAGFARVSLPSS